MRMAISGKVSPHIGKESAKRKPPKWRPARISRVHPVHQAVRQETLFRETNLE
jgi:hypothetical protein